MINKTWVILFSFILFTYSSCRTTSVLSKEDDKSVFITDQQVIFILPTDSYKEELEIYQNINGRFNKQTYNLQTIINLSDREISVSAFSAMGNSIYDLHYSENEIIYNSIISVSENSGLYLIADIQLCYYPSESVEKMINASGLSFFHIETDDGFKRLILKENELVISIERKGNTLQFKNLLRNYEYSIEEL